MDHSNMDHSGMNHGGHSGMEMPQMCSMNMLFTWNTKNLCLVFRSWHVRSMTGLVFSLLAVVALTAAYEALRSVSRQYEKFAEKQKESTPIIIDGESVTERIPSWWSGRSQVEAGKRAHIIKAAFYAAQTFYAFMLMLLFMTYNGWVMLSMFIGSFIGFFLFGGDTSATKDGACH